MAISLNTLKNEFNADTCRSTGVGFFFFYVCEYFMFLNYKIHISKAKYSQLTSAKII